MFWSKFSFQSHFTIFFPIFSNIFIFFFFSSLSEGHLLSHIIKLFILVISLQLIRLAEYLKMSHIFRIYIFSFKIQNSILYMKKHDKLQAERKGTQSAIFNHENDMQCLTEYLEMRRIYCTHQYLQTRSGKKRKVCCELILFTSSHVKIWWFKHTRNVYSLVVLEGIKYS